MLTTVSKLLRLAWPVTLARLGVMAMGLCDVIVVGQLAPKELAYQALGWAPTGVLLVTGIGMLTAVQVLASRALGADDPKAAGGVWQRGMVVSAAGGALAILVVWMGGASLFTFFGIASELAGPSAAVMRILILSVPLNLGFVASAFFLEAIQKPLPATIVMWGANGVNFVLNLLWVPDHGAVGSAWATFGARAFLFTALIIWMPRIEQARQAGLFARAKTSGYGEFFSVGFAAAISQAVETAAFHGMTIFAGRVGGSAVATYQILLNILGLVFMFSLGFSAATTVLTSDAVGRNDMHEAGRTSWMGLSINSFLMLCIGALLYLWSEPVARAYTADPDISHRVAALMPLICLIIVPDGGQTIMASTLRAHRDNWFPTASHLVAYLLIMPGFAIGLAEINHMGVTGLILAILASSICSAGVLITRLWVLTGKNL